MTTFDKREEAFERQFVHDEGVRFKALARQDRAARALGGRAARQDRHRSPSPTPRYWPPSNSSITVTPRSPSRNSEGSRGCRGFDLRSRDTASDGRTARQSHRRDQGRAICVLSQI